jgi:hypothetical protein
MEEHMKMGRDKQRFAVVFLAMFSVLFVCGSAGAEFDVNNPPVPMNGDPVLGVRFTGFSNSCTSCNDLVMGVPPLDGTGDPNRQARYNFDNYWKLDPGCNRLRVSLSGFRLEAEIGHGDTCTSIVDSHIRTIEDIRTLFWDAGGAAFESGLNILQINIASLDGDTSIDVNDFQWAGVYPFGNFCSTPSNNNQISVTGNNGTSYFAGPGTSATYEANLVLHGTSFNASYVELVFGRFDPPNHPPNCVDGVISNPTMLWPANGDMWEVGVAVTDPDGDPVTVRAIGIRQDEPVCDSASPCQAYGTIIDGTAKLRAKRNPTGNGRVYTVSFSADDGKNGQCTGEVKVSVPKNRGKNVIALDDGPLYDSAVP